ncbi:hypothetical protein L6164_028402 [Bauhinia variegata]|uniref:Uncharacterized protein n=1 Tax=Bauhinia variegata TaxID=167791 RepID=A0ACB9L6E5_BAUVA|nr:hypothetical protein L6164_028402 [Bauhinia variegata]
MEAKIKALQQNHTWDFRPYPNNKIVVGNKCVYKVKYRVEFLICLLLTILGYIPGIIYALYAIIFVDHDQYFDEYRRPLYA